MSIQQKGTPQTDRTAVELPEIGEFMRHFAHELGNPVAAIKMSSEMLQGDLPDDVRTQLMEIVTEEIGRLEMLIERAAFLTNMGAPALQESEVARIVEAAVEQTRERCGEVAIGSLSIDDGLTVAADAGLMVRVFREILENAVQAGATQIDIIADSGFGGCTIVVKDDGEGVENDVNSRIFEPFYTTRDGRLGVGLNIARAIAESHGGSLDLRNESHQGAQFVLHLPEHVQNQSQT